MSYNRPPELGGSTVSLDGMGAGFKRVIVPFTTEESWLKNRIPNVNSSDIGDLFGVGYHSYQELFHQKKNGIESPFEGNERTDWGKAFEPVIASEFARRNNWTIRKKSEYIYIPELRLGSSFDYSILENCGTNKDDLVLEEVALAECKNVGVDAYKRDWIKGFEIQAPAKIELQVQTELLVSGLKKCFICVCIGGNQGLCLAREANPKIQEAILKKVELFWESVDASK